LLEPHLLQAGTSLLSPGIVEMSDAQNVPDEEVFGPLLCVWRYDNFNEAIALANNTRYGLACGLISPDREQLTSCCWRRAGIVNWNKPLTGAASTAPLAAWAPQATIAPAPGMPPIIAPGLWRVSNRQSLSCRNHSALGLISAGRRRDESAGI
jgi:succinylglutamic semialdehyde dehydrogenase